MAIHYAVYWILQYWIDVNIAFTIGYLVSFCANYYLSAHFTFKEKTSARNGAGFAGAHIFNYFLQMGLFNFFLWIGIHRILAPFAVFSISVPINFILVRAGIAESREDYFYHDVMLGINRAVDWVCARPDVDLNNVSYSGSSQGGGFGLFLTYLNTHFTKAFVAVCAITGHYGYRQNRMSGWPKLIDRQQPAKRAVAERNAAYFDGVNFAARIKTPIRFIVGFADMTCPPADVYAAYNVCPAKDKAIMNAIGSGPSWFDWHAKSLKTATGFDYEAWLRTPRETVGL